jgi:K+-sensing histidine kinase KdpD
VSDTVEMLEAMDAGTLARTIAVAGLQVSQAADELQQAAEKLLGAEGAARDVESRARAAEEQLAQGATKNAELLEVLVATREQQTGADERMRRAEQRLQVSTERTQVLEEQLVAAQARVAQLESRPPAQVVADVDRNELAEAIATEVRRPLTSILGLTLSLKHAETGSSEGREMIRQLSASARKLDRLVGEMLAIDAISSGSYGLTRRRTDLEAMVRRIMEESPDLEGRDVHAEVEHVAVEVDPGLTEQIVEALFANAGRRTAEGNPVWVKLEADRGGAVLSVGDACPDIPLSLRQAKLAALQEDRGDAKGNPVQGPTGLALLTRLAEIHGGRAWAEERLGGGASFCVFLPGVEERPAEEPEPNPGRPLALVRPPEQDDADNTVAI